MERAQQGEPINDMALGNLRLCPVFRDLEGGVIRDLITIGTVRQYAEKEAIIPQDEEPAEICVVVCGEVRVVWLSGNGRELTLNTGTPGYLIPTAVLQRATVLAMEDGTRVVHFPQQHLRQFIARHPSLIAPTLDLLAEQLGHFLELLEDNILHDVKQRLAHTLIRLVQERGRSTLSVTHEDLAGMVGTRREQVTRCLCDFRRRAWVDSEPGRVIVLDLEALALV